jgi:hypothetical protein
MQPSFIVAARKGAAKVDLAKDRTFVSTQHTGVRSRRFGPVVPTKFFGTSILSMPDLSPLSTEPTKNFVEVEVGVHDHMQCTCIRRLPLLQLLTVPAGPRSRCSLQPNRLNVETLSAQPLLLPNTVFHVPEREYGLAELAPSTAAHARDASQPFLIVGEPAAVGAPRMHEEEKVTAMFLCRQVLRVGQIRVHGERQEREICHDCCSSRGGLTDWI